MKLLRHSSSSYYFRLLAACTLCVMAAAPNAAWAQSSRRNAPDTSTRSYTIRGAVRSAMNDQILQMVRVDLMRFTGETISTVFTRSNGDFEFTGLGPGEYYLDIKHDGFEPMREKVEIMSSSRVGVYIFLRPLNEVHTVAKSPAVSARDLAIPKKAAEAYNKGMEQMVLKNSPEASLKFFDKAIEALPTYYEAHHMRAVANLQLGRLEEAENGFRASMERSDNKYAEPYFGLAALQTTAKRFDQAVTYATQGLAIDNDAWRGHFEMARALAGLTQYDRAAQAIAEARQRKQDYADIYLVSANINMHLQDAKALLTDLDTFLKLQPEGPMAEQARKMRESIRGRMAVAQPASTPPPEKKPQ